MSLRRRRRRRSRQQPHGEVSSLVGVSLALVVLFGTAATTAETTERGPDDEPPGRNVTESPGIATTPGFDSYASDAVRRAWSAVDYRTVSPSDYRTIPWSAANGYRTVPSSAVHDYRPIADLQPPPPLSADGSRPLNSTEAASIRRPAAGQPSATSAWNRYPHATDNKQMNRYEPTITYDTTPSVYQSNTNTQTSRPAHKTMLDIDAWTMVAPLIKIEFPWLAKLRTVEITHWILFMVAKVTVLIATKVILFAKAFLVTNILKIILLPILPVFWSWLAIAILSADGLNAGTAKPTNAVNAGTRRRLNCRNMSRISCLNRSSNGPVSSAWPVESDSDRRLGVHRLRRPF